VIFPCDRFTDRGIKALPCPPEIALPPEKGDGASRATYRVVTADGSTGKELRQADYFDPEQNPSGFGVRVSYRGTKTFIFMYRYNGEKRRMKIGVFGPSFGLSAAREVTRDAAEAVRKGRDPASDRKAARVRVDAVKDLATRYIEEYAKPNKRSWKKDAQILEREVIPYIGRKRIVDVTRGDIRDEVLKRIVVRGAPVRANHTLEVIRKMFNWAIQEHDLLPTNPAALLQKPGGSVPGRSRYLSPSEFKRYWAALTPELIGEKGVIAFQLLTLTAQREMEVIRARWPEIDFEDELWTIPADNAKNRHEHVVPLAPQALLLFRRLRALAQPGDEFVFQSPLTLSHMRRVFIEKRIIKIRNAAGIDDFTVHDLRRSATTYWGKLNIDPALKKRLLNHTRRGDVTAIYDRFEYLDQKREALAKWEKLLLEMVRGRAETLERVSEATVVALRAGPQ